MSHKSYIFILLSLGLLTRFMFFGHPNETVFDEVHFGKFVSAYYTSEFYFDIHPALGKLLIAGFANLSDFKPEFAFAEIGDKFPDKQYMILRFLPSLAGALLPLVIYLLIKELGIGKFLAFLGGLLIVFENAFLTQSRYILMDPFMFLFGFSSLLFYFKHKNSGSSSIHYLLLSGIFSGFALSIKWIALSFVVLPLAVEGLTVLSNLRELGFKKLNFSKIAATTIILIFVPAIIYFSVFMIDFYLLNKSGTGDAFMSPGFQKTLAGSRYEKDSDVKASNIFQKFTELNAEMYKANQRLNATHPYSSKWFTWPFMTRPIYYWVNGNARIYLIGNPVIWWLSTIAVLFSILYYLPRIKYLRPDNKILFLLGGYVLNLLPFIGVKRIMFLYHYLTAYVFAIMILVWLISQHNSIPLIARKKPKIASGVILFAVIMAFIFFAPLNYGLELPYKAYETRTWLDSWK